MFLSPSFSFFSVLFFQPLDDASLTELKSALNGFLAKGEVLKLETKVWIFDLQRSVTKFMLMVSVTLIFTKMKDFIESCCFVTSFCAFL